MKHHSTLTWLIVLISIMGCGPKIESALDTDNEGHARTPRNLEFDTQDTEIVLSLTDSTSATDTVTLPTFTTIAGGYVVAPPWRGWGSVSISGAGSTIAPTDFSQLEDGAPLCASGTVAAMSNWSGTATVGFAVNQSQEADQPTLAVSPNPGGVVVRITNPGQTELRVRIQAPATAAGDKSSWCYVLSGQPEQMVPWTEFNTRCWDNSGYYYEGEPIVRAEVMVPGHNTTDRPYDYCVTALYPYEDDSSFTRPIDTEADTGYPIDTAQIPPNEPKGVVAAHGRLQVSGGDIVDESGAPTQIRGLSLFWSQWGGKYYNTDLINWLVSDWNIDVVRAALGIRENDGYLRSPTVEMDKIITVVNAAIEAGIYVIIDWHAHDANLHPVDARAFFEVMAQLYGDYPNVIYEIWNEPLDYHSWNGDIKPYAEYVIEGIRAYDPDNMVIVGTPVWSQKVKTVIGSEIDDPNVAYTMHFYVGMHGATLRTDVDIARGAGIPVVITEWGVWSDGYQGADHTNPVDMDQLTPWLDWADANGLSMAMWSVNDKDEPSAIVKPGATSTGNWTADDLTTIGTTMRPIFRGEAE